VGSAGGVDAKVCQWVVPCGAGSSLQGAVVPTEDPHSDRRCTASTCAPDPCSPSWPRDLWAGPVDDVVATFPERLEATDVTLVASDFDWTWGSGSTKLEGAVSVIVAWLTCFDASGLSGQVPSLAAWL
jgi:hypothetical protein